MPKLQRCSWAESSDEMRAYHDEEWGRPSHDDRYLFELLILEGAQAGLSWSTVLRKRENYRSTLDDFDYTRIARYSEARLARLLENAGLVRHRQKIASLPVNANAFIAVRKEFGSFDAYLWNWVSGTPVVTRSKPGGDWVTRTDLSDAVSKDLKKRGFKFVGTTIVYAYLQAVGVVDDHALGCPAAR